MRRLSILAAGTVLCVAAAGQVTAGANAVVGQDVEHGVPLPGDAAAPALPRLTPDQEVRARALEGELRCPVCRSQSIRQSRSFMADDMRTVLRRLVAEGRTDEEVRAFFVERYGTWVLLTPPKRGFNLAAYLLPALVVGFGALALAFAARRWSRAARDGEPAEPPLPSRHLARLERELEEIE